MHLLKIKVYVKFSEKQADLKAIIKSYLGRQYYWVATKKCEAEIPIKKGSASPSMKRTKFPLILSKKSTVHKIKV